MLYIATLLITVEETSTDYVKRETLTETQLIDAVSQAEAEQKIQTFYNNKQTSIIKYNVMIQSINSVL